MNTDIEYRDQLVEQIKASGKELIDRAESLVDKDLKLISDFNIFLHFGQESYPVITITTELINKEACDTMRKEACDMLRKDYISEKETKCQPTEKCI